MQRIVGTSAMNADIAVKRSDPIIDLKGTPQLKEIKDNFGNEYRLGVRPLAQPRLAMPPRNA